ncbi:MAG TPA: hypothetical protein VG266_06170 [Candidatus Dormibacteraeota bacterium]|jgi:MYXO-CTERM domain-containing protein|nr:hypothetical protein [Candidatus Dormibacteraeota bacterium]
MARYGRREAFNPLQGNHARQSAGENQVPYRSPELERLGNLRRIAGTSIVASIGNPSGGTLAAQSGSPNTTATSHGLGPSAVAGAGLVAAGLATRRRRDDAHTRSD